jgi:hypothetical protein
MHVSCLMDAVAIGTVGWKGSATLLTCDIADETYTKSEPSHSPIAHRNLSLDCFKLICD